MRRVTFRRAAVVLAVALATSTGALSASGAPGSALADAFFHTQSTGNRGVDVQAIQHLLTQHGHDVQPDGAFTDATAQAVQAFQRAQGLDADGIVGPRTWEALVPELREGASGEAVKALQLELNAKRRLELAVNGTFDAATTDAVREFQEHSGIGGEGVADANTWKNLVWHYDYPDFGGAGMCDQDPDGNGEANWATGAAIGQLEQAARGFAEAGKGELPVGDAAKEHGGELPGHGSHQVGLDIDLWPIRTDAEQCTAGRITWRDAEYDRDATRELVKKIRDAAPGHVALVLFNDPKLIEEGLTTEEVNHDNHLHVRYCEAVHPEGRYTC